MKAAIVYNPRAGQLGTERTVDWAAQALHQQGWQVAVRSTQWPGQMHALAAAAAAEGLDAIFAAGGDGTVSAVAEAIAGSTTTLGVLPIGTANLWATELGLAERLSSAPAVQACIEAQLAGSIRAVDMGRSDGRKFLLWAGLGLDAYVISKIEPRPDVGKRLGALYFYLAGLLAAVDYHGASMSVRTEKGRLAGHKMLAVVANIRLYLGNDSVLDTEARVDDGLLEVWVMEGKNYIEGLTRLIQYKRGQHLSDPAVQKIRGSQIEIEVTQPMPLQFDGEYAGLVKQARFEVQPKDLQVFVPRRDGLRIFSAAA